MGGQHHRHGLGVEPLGGSEDFHAVQLGEVDVQDQDPRLHHAVVQAVDRLSAVPRDPHGIVEISFLQGSLYDRDIGGGVLPPQGGGGGFVPCELPFSRLGGAVKGRLII